MIDAIQFPLFVFTITFLVLWAAALVGARFRSLLSEEVREDFGVVMTATLTLLGLIVGFTFSMAVTRYDLRKLDEEAEANAIGTEYTRAELLPASDRDAVRRLLREYLDQRILFYKERTREGLQHINATTSQLQAKLWEGVKTPSLTQPTPTMALVVSGMNDVLNSQGYTQAAWWNRIPGESWVLLGIIAICCNLMIGLYLRRVRSRSVLLMIFPAIVSVSFLLIADIDYPRGGLIHVTPRNLIAVGQSLRP